MKPKMFIFIPAILLLITGVAYWRLTAHPPSPDEKQDIDRAVVTVPGPETESPKAEAESPKVETEEEKARRQLFGVWQDHYKGKRTMTLNKDGSATMVVELAGIQAALFADKLRFDMKWSLDGKILTKKTVSGEPADKVNLILNTMGNTAEETILELSENRLLLLDKDGKTKYDWQRVKLQPEPKDSGSR